MTDADPAAALPDPIARAAARLAGCRRVVVLTGAGVSAESDIPTYRGGAKALWRDFDPMTLATPRAWDRDPALVAEWYDERRLHCLAALPNPGHLALVALERRVRAAGGTCTLLTQNVDRLHHKAGSRDVVELHGNLIEWRCTETHRVVELEPAPFDVHPPRSPFAPADADAGDLRRWRLRPHVVWFGEMLPEDAIGAAERATASCDAFLSVGTSSAVWPAAGFLELAREVGAATIEVNPGDTEQSGRVEFRLRGPGGAVLPALVDAAFPGAADASAPTPGA